MTILDQLTGCARERTVQAKLRISLEELKQQALSLPKGNFTFEKAIKKPGLSFICECKKASPSKGIIAQEFPYLQIAKDYEAAGADCISVLTEPKWFLGSDEYLKKIAGAVSVPCLRKDFTVDEYMIYKAKMLGASAVLLICFVKTAVTFCSTPLLPAGKRSLIPLMAWMPWSRTLPVILSPFGATHISARLKSTVLIWNTSSSGRIIWAILRPL